MGQELEMELDVSDKSSVGLSPITVLPSHQHCLNVKKRYKKGNPTGKDEFFKLKEDFAEIKFARIRSSPCKNRPSRSHGLEDDIEIQQGSMYQSSCRHTDVKKMGTLEGRKKIEISCSRSSDASFSDSIFDSLCGSDDDDSEHRPSVISQSSNMTSPSVSSSWACLEQNSSDFFIDFFINSDVWDRNSSAVEGIDSRNSKVISDKILGSPIGGNSPLRKDTVQALHKSLSTKVDVTHLQSPRQSDCSSRGSPKVSFSHIKKRLNPFTKSKSLRNPVSHLMVNVEVKSTGINATRNRTYRKSLLNDFSKTMKHSDIISEFIDRDIQYSGLACSPVHLHGILKIKNRKGLPYFEFRVNCPEDVYIAKTWKVGNALNWIYTFHSIDNRKKNNSSGLRSHDCEKDSPMVAQMIVSCNLCSKVEDRVVDNSMMTEFVLYDLTHSRRSVSSEKKSNRGQDVSKALKACPLPSKELHPDLEIAAIVLRIPFQKRESLKYKREDMIDAKAYSRLSGDLSSVVEHCRKSLHDRKIQEQVKVVLPTGNHGLPGVETRGPTSLLDRWKHGGGCDCGGWDMACPLILLGNPSIQIAEDHLLMKEHKPLELFLQGAKENTPTFSMTIVEEGEYAVDFHARLSPLQAFAICVAILHGTSTFSSPMLKKNQQL